METRHILRAWGCVRLPPVRELPKGRIGQLVWIYRQLLRRINIYAKNFNHCVSYIFGVIAYQYEGIGERHVVLLCIMFHLICGARR